MSNKKQQWHSLGDFLQAKEERERTQGENKATDPTALSDRYGRIYSRTNSRTYTSTTPVITPVSTGVPTENSNLNSSASLGTSLPEIRSESEK
jgi:hypothetical protein